jgi:hypothetical protein
VVLDLKIYGEAAKFQTKLIEVIEVDLTVHLIETIIDMWISLQFHVTSVVGEQSELVHSLPFIRLL